MRPNLLCGVAGLLLCCALPALAQDAVAEEPAATGVDFAADPMAAPPVESLTSRLGALVSLRAGAWTQDRELSSDTLTTVASLRARLAPRLSDELDGFAEGWVQADSARGSRADLVEGWLRYASGPLELRAGRQIIVWGRADRLNPTDNIGGRDYTLLVASDDEQRQGAAMVQARIGVGTFTFDALWLPEFRPIRFPLEQDRPGIALLPDEQVRDSGQFALKLDRSGGSFDWSLSFFSGADRNRDFVASAPPLASPPGTRLALQQRYPKLRVYGADLAGAMGRFGYRAEVAFTEVLGVDTPFRKNSNIWAVAGFDTTLDSGWNLNLQYSLRHIFDYQDPRLIADPATRAIASLSAAVNNQLDATQNGITVRVARKWLGDTLDFELAAITYFETGEAAIRPRLGYAINDRLRIAIGADVFVGPELSAFGRVRKLSAGWLQLTSGF